MKGKERAEIVITTKRQKRSGGKRGMEGKVEIHITMVMKMKRRTQDAADKRGV